MKIPRAALLLVLLPACAAPRPGGERPPPAVKPGALDGGRIRASTLADPAPHEIPAVIGVLTFANDSADKSLDPLGGALADQLSADLATRAPVRLVERRRIAKILDELYFSEAEPVSEQTAVKAGKLLGANIVALGGLSRLGGGVVVTVRLVAVQTGEVIGGATREASGVAALPAAVTAIADDLARGLRAR